MKIIFCADPLLSAQPDRAFDAEVRAAELAGLTWEIISFERLTRDENAELAARRIKRYELTEPAIYRGWMLTPAQYQALYDALQARNLLLINSPDAYRHCHYLPDSYERIAAYTPRSVWLPLPDCLDETKVRAALQTFGDKPLILKDCVKSRKHEWHEACFIPDASDDAAVERVVARFVELQGADLSGGLVFRQYVELKSAGTHAQSGMPLAREFRLFFLQGRLVHQSRYWAQGEYDSEAPPLELFRHIAQEIRSEFFTMDVAQKTDGEWIIVELGDAQVAGLPDESEAETFYRALAAMSRFTLYAGEEPMGWSALENRDPPMGVAEGVFYPNAHYARICETARAFFVGERRRAAWEKVEALELSVRPADGPAFKPVGGLDLFDVAEELEDASARRLTLLGLPRDEFARYFDAS